jgi:hypothetical protein
LIPAGTGLFKDTPKDELWLNVKNNVWRKICLLIIN